MGALGRTVGTLAFTLGGSLLGPVGFATYGAALGSFAAGILFSGGKGTQGPRLSDLEGETLDYGAPLNRFYGVMKVTGMPIDARQFNNQPQAIEETQTTKKSGGIFGFGGVKNTVYTYTNNAAYLIGKGNYRVERIYFEDGKGKHLLYNRAGTDSDARGYDLNAVSVGGRVVGETGDGIELWRGFLTQPASPYLLSQHGGQVSAHRGYSYIVLHGQELENGQGKITVVATDLSGVNSRKRIIETTLTEGGVPDERIWITGLDEPISAHSSGGGALLSGGTSRSEFLSQIALLGLCDLPQVDGLFQDRPRQSPLYYVLQLDEIGAREWINASRDAEGDLLKIQPVNVRELPSSLKIQFQDPNLDYAQNYAQTRRESATHENEQTISLPVAITLSEAQFLCDTLMDEAWAARATVELTLLPSRIQAAVGDVLLVPDDTDPENIVVHTVRITEQTLSPDGLIACKGSFYDGGVYGQYREIEQTPVAIPVIERAIAPLSRAWDLPAFDNRLVQANGAGVLVASCAPGGTYWAGAVWELQNGPSEVDPELIQSQSIMGRVLTAHTFSKAESYDRVDGVTLRVELDFGGLSPAASEVALRRDGANEMAVQCGPDVMMLQFYDAVPVAGNSAQWDISGIVIGRHATDALSIPANAPCLLLRDSNGKETDGPVWSDLPLTLRGQTLQYVTSTNDKRARNLGVQSLVWNAETLVPRSPVVESAVLQMDGTVLLSGRARTRYKDESQQNALAHRLSEPATAQGFPYLLRNGVNTLIFYTTDPRASFDYFIPASFAGTSGTLTVAAIGMYGAGHETTFSF